MTRFSVSTSHARQPDGGVLGRDTDGEAILPTWDLGDLYHGPDDPAIEADGARLLREAQAFETRLKGRLATLDAPALADAIAAFEAIEEGSGRLGAYGGLLFAGDSTDPVRGRFYQSISETLTAIGTPLLFFTLELAALPDAHLDAL